MVTITIKENSKQAKLFIEYAKSLSFVKFAEIDHSKNSKKRTSKVSNTDTLKTFENTDKGIDLTKSTIHEGLDLAFKQLATAKESDLKRKTLDELLNEK